MKRIASLVRGGIGDSSVLMAGSLAAQMITVLASPILTRIYSPGEMGTFALYTSVIAILALVSTARYDFAIISPRSGQSARILVQLVMIVSGTVLLSSTAVLVVWHFITAMSAGSAPAAWLWVALAGAFLSALQAGYGAYLLRSRRYRSLALTRVFMSVASAALAIGMGSLGFGTWGLLISSLIALLLGTLLMTGQSPPALWKRSSGHRLTAVAKRYINYPRFDLPSSLIGVAGSQVPTLLLGVLFGSSFLGFYAIVDRICLAPLTVIGAAVGSVFRVRATQLALETGDFRQEYLRTFVRLILPAFIIFSPLVLFGPEIFSLVFGDKWRTAGEIAQVMAPLYFLRLIASPLSMSLYVRNRMKVDLLGQTSLGFASVAAMTIGWLAGDPWVSLRLIVLLSGALYVGYISYGWRISKALPNPVR